jgi:hypothetical protein
MRRRSFLTALAAAGGVLPASAQAAASRAPKDLKITGVEVLVTNPTRRRWPTTFWSKW